MQSLMEVTLLAENAGVPRHTFLEFINNSVLWAQKAPIAQPSLEANLGMRLD